MDYESFLELVQKRRSIRRYKSDPIPDEYVDRIIEAGRWAPSGFNLQPWEFIVVRDKKLKDSIVQLVDMYSELSARMETTRESWQVKGEPLPPRISERDYRNAPVFIIICGDTRTQVGLPMARRFDPCRIRSAFDSGLASALVYMHLAATALGLGSQWVSAVSTPYVHCLIKNILGIPEELEIYDMMVVGYPDGQPRPRLVRDREEMVHYDYCGKESFRTDATVRDFIVKIRNP